MITKILVTAFGSVIIAVAAQAQTLDPAKIKSRDVIYVSHKKLKEFPTPILEYRNFDPRRHEKLFKDIVERIVYPTLCESEFPIAVVTVDFCPEIPGHGQENERGCKDEAKGKLTIEVRKRGQDGTGFMSLIETDLEGNFDDDAYLTLFTAGEKEYEQRNKTCRPGKRARQK